VRNKYTYILPALYEATNNSSYKINNKVDFAVSPLRDSWICRTGICRTGKWRTGKWRSRTRGDVHTAHDEVNAN